MCVNVTVCMYDVTVCMRVYTYMYMYAGMWFEHCVLWVDIRVSAVVFSFCHLYCCRVSNI